jgi:superfamily II DNA or RNA helicase
MIIVEKLNEAYIRVTSDYSTEQNIKEFFTFKAPNYQFHPKYKAKIWDGNISLYDIRRKVLPGGLYSKLLDFVKNTSDQIEIKPNDRYSAIIEEPTVTREEVEEYVSLLAVSTPKGKLTAHDYQIDAIYHAIRNKKVTLKSPTSSGKSFMIYCIIQWILDESLDAKVCLLVPTVQLVNQMVSDFKEYSIINGFSVDKNVQSLFSGQSKELVKRVLVTTWQSFKKIADDKENGFRILSTYNGVIVDEAHTAKGVELQKILEKFLLSEYRIGTTGTLNTEPSTLLTIEGMLGPTKSVITTKQLMDDNKVSQLKIKMLSLKYPPAICKMICTEKVFDPVLGKKVKKYVYPEEIKYLIEQKARNSFLANLACASSGTTLLLVKHRDTHAVPLFEEVKAISKRPVYYVSGTVAANVREEIRLIANITDCIIVATYATMSTGVNIPNIRNVIFGTPSKASIMILQSIGRSLRLAEGKTHATLIDVIDDMRHSSAENYAYQHALERIEIYKKEQFEINVKEIPFKI